FASLGFDHSVSVSAAHGRGISELVEMIDKQLAREAPAAQVASASGRWSLADMPSPADASEPPLGPVSRPLSIAIVGRPNVGKSSLINAITQTERAIVSEIPGTTRDAVDIFFRHGQNEFLFIDTAG